MSHIGAGETLPRNMGRGGVFALMMVAFASMKAAFALAMTVDSSMLRSLSVSDMSLVK